MIAYLDSAVLARAYLADEPGHAGALALVRDADIGLVTGTWTRIEVSGALVRAASRRAAAPDDLLGLLDADLAVGGAVAVIAVAQEEVERVALGLVRQHGLRAMDAWHLAAATLIAPTLLEPGETMAFATRDQRQSEVAVTLGMQPL